MAERLHISPRHRSILEALLHEHLPDVETWAYGSRVNGRSHNGSDLDLVLRGPGLKKIPADQLADFRDAVRESTIPFLVEARDWARLPERFQQEIEREHVALVHDQASSVNTLGDYFDLQRGATYQSRLLGENGPALLGLASIHRNGGFRSDALRTYGGACPDKLMVHSGQLYVSLKDVTQSADLLGAVARLPAGHAPGRLTQDTVKLDPKSEDVRLDYIYWLLRTPDYRNYCRAHATGTTNLGLPREDFLAYPIPTLTSDRRGIIAALNAIEDKIELNRRMNETLEAMARALFKSWFVDFEPVRAKMEGRDTGQPQRLATLFPDDTFSTDLGEIPEGWTVRSLGELICLNYGKPLRRDKRVPGKFPVYGSGGTDSSHREPLIEHPTVVVGRKGTVGSLHWAPHGCWPIDTTYFVTSQLPLTFVYRLLQHLPLANMNTDAAVPGLNRSNAYRLRVPYSGVELVSEFVKVANGLQVRIDANERQARLLTHLRDALLPELVSGEVRVRQAEKAVASVL